MMEAVDLLYMEWKTRHLLTAIIHEEERGGSFRTEPNFLSYKTSLGVGAIRKTLARFEATGIIVHVPGSKSLFRTDLKPLPKRPPFRGTQLTMVHLCGGR